MTAILMPVAKQHFDGVAGLPLIGGKLYTFAAGTSTPKKTFTNAAGTENQPNPIPLNSRGEPAQAIYWDGAYRIELRDVDGNLVYTNDNYTTADLTAAVSAFSASLLGPNGGDLVKVKYPGANTVAETVAAAFSERVSVFRYLTAAQQADVRSFAASIDITAAIQAAEDDIFVSKKELFFPAGRYRISASIRRHEFSRWVGEARHYCILDGLTAAMTTPLTVNANAVFYGYTTTKSMGFEGGSHAVKVDVTSETAFNFFDDVLFNNQTSANFYCNKLFQTSTFRSCRFTAADYGVDAPGFTSNVINFFDCEFTQHRFESVRMLQCEVVNFYGGNFGGGGINGRTVLRFDFARGVTFSGTYFENGHSILLFETNSSNTISFVNGCHFTSALADGSGKYAFVSDGRINFGTNHWFRDSVGPARILMQGANNGFLGTTATYIDTIDALTVYKRAGPSSNYPVSAQKDLMKFTSTPFDNNPTTLGMLTGVLTVNYLSINTGGFVVVKISRRYHVNIASVGGLALVGALSLISSADTLSGSTLTVQVKTGATAQLLTLEALWTGNPTPAGSIFNCAFESDCAANANSTLIIPVMI